MSSRLPYRLPLNVADARFFSLRRFERLIRDVSGRVLGRGSVTLSATISDTCECVERDQNRRRNEAILRRTAVQ